VLTLEFASIIELNVKKILGNEKLKLIKLKQSFMKSFDEIQAINTKLNRTLKIFGKV
jgi:hypothetical protein